MGTLQDRNGRCARPPRLISLESDLEEATATAAAPPGTAGARTATATFLHKHQPQPQLLLLQQFQQLAATILGHRTAPTSAAATSKSTPQPPQPTTTATISLGRQLSRNWQRWWLRGISIQHQGRASSTQATQGLVRCILSSPLHSLMRTHKIALCSTRVSKTPPANPPTCDSSEVPPPVQPPTRQQTFPQQSQEQRQRQLLPPSAHARHDSRDSISGRPTSSVYSQPSPLHTTFAPQRDRPNVSRHQPDGFDDVSPPSSPELLSPGNVYV